jgi:hypothetical protein
VLVDVVRAGYYREIERVRRLPIAGEVLVNEGTHVQPTDVIAEAAITDKIFLLDIARGLGVDETEVKGLLVRQPGEQLLIGDVVAQVDGAIPRLVRLPVNGQFVGFHRANAVFEIGHDPIQLLAGLPGTVNSVIPEYGAKISTGGLLLQGVWGNGQINAGSLRVLVETWTVPLDASMVADIDPTQIIAAGNCLDAKVFDLLEEEQPAGLILASLAPGLLPYAAAMTIPVIILQGFGLATPADFFLNRIAPLAGETTCLNAGPVDRLNGLRPEVIIPHEVDSEAELLESRVKLQPGFYVQVCSGKAMGRVGEVQALLEEPHQFESGLQLPGAVIRLQNGEIITVPNQNLVILA